MNTLLDTSALLALYFGESGGARVAAMFGDPGVRVSISALSVGEFWGRLRARSIPTDFDDAWASLRELIDDVIPVSTDIVLASCALRQATPARLPYIDALIAATAAARNAVLIHRDAHFAAIPAGILKQEMLTEPS
ncbi:MAG TPA: PIN domain-containing protein [Thermoflexales bacterium]|nr:PIN domain-containing protein [Thermoflexales bacterium]HQX11100.1 PIN domain-containing protein [Thermoflexales bacterium]HQZ54373.1 PIN domain-containing protein [Thermoflexales bacterium]HRA52722.1 PIN domain-containing protein [Thermoflexales bacterium]